MKAHTEVLHSLRKNSIHNSTWEVFILEKYEVVLELGYILVSLKILVAPKILRCKVVSHAMSPLSVTTA